MDRQGVAKAKGLFSQGVPPYAKGSAKGEGDIHDK